VRTTSLVSAIIPTYNRAKLVSDAIQSVLRQSYTNVEIIVVDDGSSDNTCEILHKFGDAITVLRQRNAGPAAARNYGIAAAQGEFVAFLDSDDVWLPTKLERQVSLLNHFGESVPCCLTNIMMHWNDRKSSAFDISWLNPSCEEGLWTNADEILATRFVLFNQGIMIRRKVMDRVGGFDEKLRLLEDRELSLRLSLVGPWAFIDEPLVAWRETQGSCYQKACAEGLDEKHLLVAVLKNHLVRVQHEAPQRRRLIRTLGRELNRARRQLRAAKLEQADFPGVSLVGKGLSAVERYRRAMFRRSSAFPRMQVEPVISGDLGDLASDSPQQVQPWSC
jgi:glycosyltransferase involved in cell wall biosynthesis